MSEPWFPMSGEFPCLSLKIWFEISGSGQSLISCFIAGEGLWGERRSSAVRVSSHRMGLQVHKGTEVLLHPRGEVGLSSAGFTDLAFLPQTNHCLPNNAHLVGRVQATLGLFSWSVLVFRCFPWWSDFWQDLSQKFKTIIWLSFYIGGKNLHLSQILKMIL